MSSRSFGFLLALSLAGPALAAQPEQPDLSLLQGALRGATPDSVGESAIPGIYEVVVGGQIMYISKDGRYVVQGDLIDLVAGANLTENRRGQMRVKAIDAVGEDNMVVFTPSGPTRHTVTVFTDIDCGYCRMLHQEIASYTEQGIKVRYLAYPRAGVNSPSYDKAVTVWCSEDRKTAMTRAKQGESLSPKTCPNPVKAQYELGQSMGVRGTPSLVLENGEMIPGYVPAARLANMLDTAATAAAN